MVWIALILSFYEVWLYFLLRFPRFALDIGRSEPYANGSSSFGY